MIQTVRLDVFWERRMIAVGKGGRWQTGLPATAEPWRRGRLGWRARLRRAAEAGTRHPLAGTLGRGGAPRARALNRTTRGLVTGFTAVIAMRRPVVVLAPCGAYPTQRALESQHSGHGQEGLSKSHSPGWRTARRGRGSTRSGARRGRGWARRRWRRGALRWGRRGSPAVRPRPAASA